MDSVGLTKERSEFTTEHDFISLDTILSDLDFWNNLKYILRSPLSAFPSRATEVLSIIFSRGKVKR